MTITEHLHTEHLHHAYLLEGERDGIMPELLSFFESAQIQVSNNPDFLDISVDSFKIEDARNLKAFSGEKNFSGDKKLNKKIFIISANNFALEAQNTLLKIFEEPSENTHFFLITPETKTLLPTLLSRFYIIKSETNTNLALHDAEKFISMSLPQRIDFLKNFLNDAKDDEEDAENLNHKSARSLSLEFLNAVEITLHKKSFPVKNNTRDLGFFDKLFKAREFIRQPGSSIKSLLEGVALVLPIF